jgi:hypothetical protein
MHLSTIAIWVLLLPTLILNAQTHGSRQFLLAYATGGVYRIMVIDEDGNVLQRSKPLLETNFQFFSNGVAIGRGIDGTLNLYTPRSNGIVRNVIDPNNFHIIRSELLLTSLASGTLNVTYRHQNNFLTAVVSNNGKEQLIAFGLTNSGQFRGDHWSIHSFNCNSDFCYEPNAAGVSLDGKTAFFDRSNALFKINLNSNGRTVGQPRILVHGSGGESTGSIGSIDFSATVLGSDKFFIYNLVNSSRGSDPGTPDFVYVNKIKKGLPIDSSLKIAQYPWIRFGQSVAIDPQAKFIIYYSESQTNEYLMYQKLDENGAIIGKRIVLESDGVSPILDLVQQN